MDKLDGFLSRGSLVEEVVLEQKMLFMINKLFTKDRSSNFTVTVSAVDRSEAGVAGGSDMSVAFPESLVAEEESSSSGGMEEWVDAVEDLETFLDGVDVVGLSIISMSPQSSENDSPGLGTGFPPIFSRICSVFSSSTSGNSSMT